MCIAIPSSPSLHSQLLGTGEVRKYGYSRPCLALEWMACGDAQALIDRTGRALDVEAAGERGGHKSDMGIFVQPCTASLLHASSHQIPPCSQS